MSTKISDKSIVGAYQAGAVLASAVNGDHVDLYEWADKTREVANWGSLSTALSIKLGSVGWGTNSVQAVNYALKQRKYDRIIMISDMQFNGGRSGWGNVSVPTLPNGVKGYTINLGNYSNPGLVVGDWSSPPSPFSSPETGSSVSFCAVLSTVSEGAVASWFG